MRRYQPEDIPGPDSALRDTYRERERVKWGSQPEFFVILVSLVSNIAVLQRFPIYCYVNGGVVFLVPYFLFLLLFTVPIMVMEAGLGQYAGVSAITLWRACPLFKGVGFAVLLTLLLLTSVQGVSLAWTLYYIFSSASSYLPWTSCYNSWNLISCVSPHILSHFNQSIATSPAYEFWIRQVLQLQKSGGIGDLGTVNIALLISLAAAWFIIMILLCAGTKSLGKIMYIVVIATFLLLVVFLVRGLTLPGGIDGLLHVAFPDVSHFLYLRTWLDGCKHAFFTYAAGMAVTVTLSSYNRVAYNSSRDVILLPIVAVFVNVLGAAVVFAFLGFVSEKTGKSINDLVLNGIVGPQLSFVPMADAMGMLPIPQLWCALYFVLDLLLKLGPQLVMVQVIVSSITDDITSFGHRCWAKFMMLILVCGIACTLGVPCVTKGGLYVLNLIEYSSVRFGPYFCAIFQCIGIACVYGMEQVYQDITLIRGHRPCVLWKIFWCFISPALPLAMFVYQMVTYSPMTYDNYYLYPMWARVVSWLVSLLPVLLILLGMVFQLARFSGKGIREVVRPAETWGPIEGRQRQRFIPSAPPATGTMEIKPPPYVEYERAWAY